MSSEEHRCHNIEALKREGDVEALSLLKKIAAQVRPIMKNRQWRVGLLKEFIPSNPNLLGININSGEAVKIRLRLAHNLNEFLPFENLIGTMLHELVHIVHGPHDTKFYALLDKVTEECENLMAKGITGGEGFQADGKKLGGAWCNPSEYDRRSLAAKAAANREQRNIMIRGSGQRLGGGHTGKTIKGKPLTPKELMLIAAERRRKDNLWCGREDAEKENDSNSNDHSATINLVLDSPVTKQANTVITTTTSVSLDNICTENDSNNMINDNIINRSVDQIAEATNEKGIKNIKLDQRLNERQIGPNKHLVERVPKNTTQTRTISVPPPDKGCVELWNCSSCTYTNNTQDKACSICGTSRWKQ
eukprot:Ihof_evm15s21 gene=Ihof_evmTU15s21